VFTSAASAAAAAAAAAATHLQALQCTADSKNTDAARTTVLLRNVPSSYRQEDMLCLLNSQGFAEKYNFLYLPMDFATGANLGFAFVNLESWEIAEAALHKLQGFSRWSDTACRKTLQVCWSDPHQGLDSLIERFRNSQVMHKNVPREYKPLLLKRGAQVPFPKPTRRVRCPL
jgi:RNA recognition motif-containing protein